MPVVPAQSLPILGRCHSRDDSVPPHSTHADLCNWWTIPTRGFRKWVRVGVTGTSAYVAIMYAYFGTRTTRTTYAYACSLRQPQTSVQFDGRCVLRR
jgi:hypothetical protein